MPISRCAVCGVVTREKEHCKPSKPKARLQSTCPDCGKPSRNPKHCEGKPRCDVPGCTRVAAHQTVGGPPKDPNVVNRYRTCEPCLGIDVGAQKRYYEETGWHPFMTPKESESAFRKHQNRS